MDFRKTLQSIENNGLLRATRAVESSPGAVVRIDGRPYVNFASNNYLGLAGHVEVRDAVCRAVREWGWGTGGSRLMCGTHRLHEELEGRIASFKKCEAALLYTSGYAANTGAIPALCDTGTIVLSDSLNHASLIDGIRLSRTKVKVYPHCDWEHAAELLETAEETSPMIVTDGVFSMDGDLAPVSRLVDLAERTGGLLYLDDAHGTGVVGPTGRGTTEYSGAVSSGCLLQMGTLSKALGSIGGFVAGSRDAIQLLKNRARSFIFTTSLPPAACAAGLASLSILEREGAQLREQLKALCVYLVSGLERLGMQADFTTPIFPLKIGSADRCLRISGRLLEEGILAPAIRPPTVPENSCRLRITLTALHDTSHIDHLLRILETSL